MRNTYGFTDIVIKTLGRHTVSAGIDLMHQFAEEYTQYPTHPEVTFTGAYTGNGMVDFLLGYMHEFKQGAGEIADIAGWQFAPFAQDDWKVRPNLTLNIGLRWDPNFAPTSKGGRGAAFVAGQQSYVFPNAPTGLIFPGDDGMKATLMPDSTGYWEPRLGVAWQPKSCLRPWFMPDSGCSPARWSTPPITRLPISRPSALPSTSPGTVVQPVARRAPTRRSLAR